MLHRTAEAHTFKHYLEGFVVQLYADLKAQLLLRTPWYDGYKG